MSNAPYPGLRPFNKSESDIFFGREEQVDRLLDKIGRAHFVAMVGSSGCGKSSLLRAGLIAALQTGFLPQAGGRWRIATTHPGDRPLRNLTQALLDKEALGLERAQQAEAANFLMATLRRGPLGLVEALRETPLPERTNLLLVVDQFEEIFRYRGESDRDEADAFVSLLLATAEHAQQQHIAIYTLIAMRSDFLGDCAVFPGLPEAISDNQFLVPRPTRDQRREAIVGPAEVFDGFIEPALVNTLLNDMGDDPDQLPLMQHTLMRMWSLACSENSSATPAVSFSPSTDDAEQENSPEGIELTSVHYKNQKIGGLANALSQHADEAFRELNPQRKSEEDPPNEKQRIAEVLFRCLSGDGTNRRDIRRPSHLGEIAAVANVSLSQLKEVVDVFRQPGRSFLSPPSGVELEEQTIIDVSHESLLRQWKRLTGWLEKEQKSAETYQDLKLTARRWKEGTSKLWGNPNLDYALAWKKRENPNEAWARRYGKVEEFQLAEQFLQKSDKQRQAEEEEKQHKQGEEHQRTVQEARQAEKQKQTEAVARLQEKAKKRLSWLSGGLAAALVVMVYALISAQSQKKAAEEQKNIANSRGLSAQSQSQMKSHPDLGLLLGVQATSIAEETREARGQLLSTLNSSPLVTFLRGHNNYVYKVAFSPVNQLLASAGEDNKIRFWDASTHQSRSSIPPLDPSFRFYSIAFSRDGKLDGKLLASVGSDGKISLWNVDTGLSDGELSHDGDSSWPISLAFSPKGDFLASGGSDHTVRLWDVDTLEQLGSFSAHPHRVTSVAFSHDGALLASSSCVTLSELKECKKGEIRLWAISYTPNQQLVPFADLPLINYQSSINAVAFSPTENILAAATGDNTVQLWDSSTGKSLGADHRHSAPATSVAFSPDGLTLASGSVDATILLWDVAKRVPMEPPLTGHSAPVTSVAFNPDGNTLVSSSEDKTLILWNLKAHPRTTNAAPISSLAPSPDSHVLAFVGNDKNILLWAVDKRPVLRSLDHATTVYSMAFSPDGETLAAGTCGVEDKGAEGKQKPVCKKGEVRLWNLTDSSPSELRLSAHSAPVLSVAFSKDGKWLASGSGDNTIILWDTATHQPRPPLTGHKDPVLSVAFSPDGKTLASGSADKTIRLWDVATYRPLGLPFLGHNGPVTKVIFSPDGTTLISTEADGTTMRWDVRLDFASLQARGCSIVNRNLSLDEWKQYVGDESYRKTCPDLPPGEGAPAAS
jgi:WD40 repeat protein